MKSGRVFKLGGLPGVPDVLGMRMWKERELTLYSDRLVYKNIGSTKLKVEMLFDHVEIILLTQVGRKRWD